MRYIFLVLMLLILVFLSTYLQSLQAQDAAENSFEKVEQNPSEQIEEKIDEDLIVNLQSGVLNIRLSAYKALKNNAPDYIPALLKALCDEDKKTRRTAAEMIERVYTPYPSAKGADRTGILGEWHKPKNLYRIHNTLPDHLPSVIPALIAALNDELEEVRAYAAITLFKLAPFAEDALDGLKTICDDPSPVVRYWAKIAIEDIDVKKWRSLRLLAQKIRSNGNEGESLTRAERDALIARVRTAPGWDWEDFEPRIVAKGGKAIEVPDKILWPKIEDQRWNTALELIRREFPNLISAAEGTDPDAAAEAIEVLDLLEEALDKRLWVLARFVDEDWDPCFQPAKKEMVKMGTVAIQALAYDYLRYPRMSLSPWTYKDLVSILEHGGVTALPIFVKALEHWRWHEVYPAAKAIQKLGNEGLPAIPIIMSAWRYGVNKYGIFEPFWDGSGPDVYESDCSMILAGMEPGALPWLERALDDDLRFVRARACRNIAELGEDAVYLIPSITALLEDRDDAVREEAARTLLRLENTVNMPDSHSEKMLSRKPKTDSSRIEPKMNPCKRPGYSEFDVPGFSCLKEESFFCGDLTDTVKIYEHDKTGLEFALVPGGTFMMGSGIADSEKPVHQVTVKPFLLCRTECTQEAWDKIGGMDDRNWRGSDLPIESVSWIDCTTWCQRAGLRLPTEAEWEYASRSGTSTRYCFGESDASLIRYAWYDACAGGQPRPVGGKWANAWGLYDIYGNVWEWCQDEYHGNYSGALSDGSAWESGVSSCRVNRGGCWFINSWYCCSANRNWNSPDFRYNDLGFRPACSLNE